MLVVSDVVVLGCEMLSGVMVDWNSKCLKLCTLSCTVAAQYFIGHAWHE